MDVSNYPQEPGVYLMKNGQGKVIYVGKAKNLKVRIRQYFIPGRDGRPMVPFLTKEAEKIETIVVESEREALILENTLIKRHQPKFNVLLKDDKTFISLMMNHRHPWPMLKIVRVKGKPKKDGLYFGPYTSTYAARQIFDLMTRLFPLRQCSDEELKRRTRPCLLHGMKKCLAPCVKLCTHAGYDAFVQGAIDFLRGQDKKIVKELRAEMEKASESLEYERAAFLLKTIRQIEHVLQGPGLVAQTREKDCDVLSLYRQGDDVVVVQLLFREGKLIGSEHYSFTEVAESDEELFSSFILQLYQDKKLFPKEILVPTAVPSTLPELIGIDIFRPKIGRKKALIRLAEKNARAVFQQEKDHQEMREKMLLDLQDKLKLNRYPERIECFDISNTAGSDLVAAMVAFTHGEKDKARTRLYKIRNLSQGDDYAAMHQVLSRRLIRAKEEQDLPDLVIVDGGKGQLSVACEVFKELDIATVDVIALAKEGGRHDRGMTRERVFLPHHSEPITLDDRSPLLFLLQRFRDAVHTKAIKFHRKKRTQRTLKTALEEIPGIGPVKQKRLLQHFGSLERIKKASPEELKKVKGITERDITKLR